MIQSKNYDGVMCTLVNVKSGKALNKGDAVKLRGEADDWYLTGGRAPHTPNSTGRVWVQNRKTAAQAEYFPGVVDAQWMPVTLAAPEDDDTRFMPL